jgi:DNA polymerase-3 subunit alpha
VVVAIYRFCLIRNTISRQGGDEKLFTDLPEAIWNLAEIVDKIEIYNLAREVLPKFDIPEEFSLQKILLMEEFVEKMYLRHLTYEGANRRYPEITEVIRERLDFELLTI